MHGGSTFTQPPCSVGSSPRVRKGKGVSIDSHTSIACYKSLCYWKHIISQPTASETFSSLFGLGCWFMRDFFLIISNNYWGSFAFRVHWVVPVHLLFKKDRVTGRNAELKGPEPLQQDFVLEASELEGEETGSPPRASAGLSHPLSKPLLRQPVGYGWACFQGRQRQTDQHFHTAQNLVLLFETSSETSPQAQTVLMWQPPWVLETFSWLQLAARCCPLVTWDPEEGSPPPKAPSKLFISW